MKLSNVREVRLGVDFPQQGNYRQEVSVSSTQPHVSLPGFSIKLLSVEAEEERSSSQRDYAEALRQQVDLTEKCLFYQRENARLHEQVSITKEEREAYRRERDDERATIDALQAENEALRAAITKLDKQAKGGRRNA